MTAARAATGKPLYAKLAPGLPDLPAVAEAAAAAGADGLSLVNTIRGLALDPATLLPRLSTGSGGLSGPALRPVALAAVHAAYRATGLPIVGMGGVETGAHALELIAAGASAVGARHGAVRRSRRARTRARASSRRRPPAVGSRTRSPPGAPLTPGAARCCCQHGRRQSTTSWSGSG